MQQNSCEYVKKELSLSLSQIDSPSVVTDEM